MKDIALGVVIRDGKVLIQQRYRRNQGMVFEFPGGSIDQGETGKQAAARELWEETGLKDLKLVSSHEDKNDFGGEIHYVVFNASPDEEPQMTDKERQQTFYWLDPSAIPLDDFYRADIDFIENHLNQYISS